MNWYKRKSLWIMTVILIAVIAWTACFVRVNKKYKITKETPYHIGETFVIENMEIKWESMKCMTQEQIMEEFDTITQADMLQWSEEGTEYCVVGVSIKNISKEPLFSTYCGSWKIACEDYGNGASYFTNLANQHLVEGLKAGQEEKFYVFFSVMKENKDLLKNNDIHIYTSLYPKEIILEGRMEEF